jgi:hypothetical protein
LRFPLPVPGSRVNWRSLLHECAEYQWRPTDSSAWQPCYLASLGCVQRQRRCSMSESHHTRYGFARPDGRRAIELLTLAARGLRLAATSRSLDPTRDKLGPSTTAEVSPQSAHTSQSTPRHCDRASARRPLRRCAEARCPRGPRTDDIRDPRGRPLRIAGRAPDGSLGPHTQGSRGKRRPYLGSRSNPSETATISDSLTTPSSLDPRRTDSYGGVKMPKTGRIERVAWSSLSLGPAFAAQGLDQLVARLLAYEYPIPA